MYIPIPENLGGATQTIEMSYPNVPFTGDNDEFFKLMDIAGDGVIKGPLNHIMARMLTIPRMIDGYIQNYPKGDEIRIYDDPPIL